jgi:anti-sigma B factor antagonist
MSTTEACITGEWTIHAIAQHREAMLLLVNEGHSAFDASGITDMDSAGLQLLLSAQRSIALHGRELRLLQASAVVKGVLASYGLDIDLQPVYAEEIAS